MRAPSKTFTFSNTVWLWNSEKSAWHFVSLPSALSRQIISEFSFVKKAWGQISVWVSIGKLRWKTFLTPDVKRGQYIIPLKAEIRKKCHISEGDTVEITIEIADAL